VLHSDTEAPEDTHTERVSDLTLRVPMSEDGFALHQLVEACPPLDPNSIYCNLLQCSHFSETSVAAELNGQLVGFTSAYLLPGRGDTLFIWQVAIAQNARGRGLAKRMIRHLLARPACQQVTRMETTITPDNQASWALFRSLARDLGAELTSSVWFERERHFGGQHADEHLLQIAPVSRGAVNSSEF
jgi:L-2,4-diaminobutyric acid acetyltransferase